MLVRNDDGRDQLGVVDLANGATKCRFVLGRRCRPLRVVNSGRLLYDSRDRQTAQGNVRYVGGLFAINIRGNARRESAQVATGTPEPTIDRHKLPVNTFMLGRPGVNAYARTIRARSCRQVLACISLGLDPARRVLFCHSR